MISPVLRNQLDQLVRLHMLAEQITALAINAGTDKQWMASALDSIVGLAAEVDHAVDLLANTLDDDEDDTKEHR